MGAGPASSRLKLSPAEPYRWGELARTGSFTGELAAGAVITAHRKWAQAGVRAAPAVSELPSGQRRHGARGGGAVRSGPVGHPAARGQRSGLSACALRLPLPQDGLLPPAAPPVGSHGLPAGGRAGSGAAGNARPAGSSGWGEAVEPRPRPQRARPRSPRLSGSPDPCEPAAPFAAGLSSSSGAAPDQTPGAAASADMLLGYQFTPSVREGLALEQPGTTGCTWISEVVHRRSGPGLAPAACNPLRGARACQSENENSAG